MAESSERQAGAQANPFAPTIPYYEEAMALIADWERDGDEFESLISRLYSLWSASGTADLHSC